MSPTRPITSDPIANRTRSQSNDMSDLWAVPALMATGYFHLEKLTEVRPV